MSPWTGLLKLEKMMTVACLVWGCWSLGGQLALCWVLYSSGYAHGSSSPTLLYNETFVDPHTQALSQDQQATVAWKGQATFVLPNKTGLGIGHCPLISQAVESLARSGTGFGLCQRVLSQAWDEHRFPRGKVEEATPSGTRGGRKSV